MPDEMKTSKSLIKGKKLSKYLIIKPIILGKYKLGWVQGGLINQLKNFINLL